MTALGAKRIDLREGRRIEGDNAVVAPIGHSNGGPTGKRESTVVIAGGKSASTKKAVNLPAVKERRNSNLAVAKAPS